MNAKIDGKNLVITIPVNSPLQPSKTGKTLLLASSHGIVPTTLVVEGKPVKIGVNAMVQL